MFSTIISIYRDKTKNNGVRHIAIKSLELFISYAKSNKTFKTAENDFNNKFSIPEKRAILVALHKIGVPVTTPSTSLFNISTVEFLSEIINKDEIKSMIKQIKNGNCDTLFYADVEKFFTENIRMNRIRNIAENYIENVMSLSSLRFDDNDIPVEIIKPDNWGDLFTPGELKTIQTFIQMLIDPSYYDSRGNIKTNEMEKIISEIKSGMWDNYLLWDNTAYQNMQLQKKSNEASILFYNQLMQNNTTTS
ncbi:hypothetical protein SEENIN0B_03245 [Salmonella enterica subsp. enterica serovar Infantis str. SARB27]|nr:hypothetical protein [Salmonella enterica]EHB43331.1 hypothetical protein SEENIN0B_03245 [Salmonella enterica subsp. enterica serovar Infantis str. SARB27]QCV26098.1 hypothetical protein FE265_15435 [Salmonella enterica subsp. enterica serovar Infantis]QCV30577.1 hypothetical protein FE168_15425 [Salmonella enterica subsp. enterica serovar Infantis]